MEMNAKVQVQSQTFSTFASMIAKDYKGAITNNSNIIGYPLMLDNLTKKVPSIFKLEPSKDAIKLKENLETMSIDDYSEKNNPKRKDVNIRYGSNEKFISLQYGRVKQYYPDMMTGSIKTIHTPDLTFDPKELDKYFLFVAQFAEAFLDIYQFTNIVIATSPLFMNNPIPGTGVQLFERLTGTSGLLSISKDFFKRAYDSLDEEQVRKIMAEHNETKELALVSDFVTRNILSKYSQNIYRLSNIVKDKVKNSTNKEEITIPPADNVTPQILQQKEASIQEVGANRRDSLSSISTLYNL